MSEEWRAAVGWEGLYEVSDAGRVRSLDRAVEQRNGRIYPVRGRTLKPAAVKQHLVVGLCRNGIQSNTKVHRLVLEAFAGPAPTGMVCCHNNGDGTDNRLENLRWDTLSSNSQDTVRHGANRNANKTHCPSGHPYSPENTYSYPTGRICKSCSMGRKHARNEQRAQLKKVS
ncbi:hypothetical protein F8M49_29970 [Rhodococcus zopfii]|uniref:HNH endonuclease n=1 Tax=Rhodococcus zopfii TaxID=43772 RepID=A0ABU3WX65_9NOCA|nr:hypothetical protein [Rhodococcus zopfii]MDV2478590.1 hypothetical protein [Rhodococcus zopfii]